MATNDQVTVDVPEQMDELRELENELVTSPQEHNGFTTKMSTTGEVRVDIHGNDNAETSPQEHDKLKDTTTASHNQSSKEVVEITTSPPPDQVESNVNVSVEEETVQPPQDSTSFSKEIERRNRRFNLYLAALTGNWNTAERIYKEDNIDIPVKLSKDGGTALHIAAAARNTDFVKKLLENMNEGDLVIKNNAGNTAFFLAAASKRVEIVKAMMENNKDIVKIRGDNDMLPLHKAALRGDKEMVEYLYEATEDELLDNNDRFKLLVNLINHGLYDVALDLVERHPQIALVRDNNEETALHLLARIPVLTRTYNSHNIRVCMNIAIYLYNEIKRDVVKRCHSVFGRQRMKERNEQSEERNEQSLRDRMNEREQRMNEREQRMNEKEQRRRKKLGWLGWIKEARDEDTDQKIPDSAFELVECLWKHVMLSDDSQILEIIRKPWSLIFEAAKQGNLRFLYTIFCRYPDLMFEVDENHYTILHFAVMYRRPIIFSFVHAFDQFKDLVVRDTDEEGNNILHLAAKLPPVDRPDIESPALHYKMVREMRWFKRVKRILHPMVTEAKNKEGKTARAIFIEQHEELRNKADKWTKKIANACIMASTLIATVVFAALFTVPGGTNEETGTPHFVRRASFIVFAVSDTLALLLSCSSILMFLAVISSRCEEADFVGRLPDDLNLGFDLLLFSVVALMVAFCATMFIAFKDGMLWMPILFMVMAIFTIFMYVRKILTGNGEWSHAVYEYC